LRHVQWPKTRHGILAQDREAKLQALVESHVWLVTCILCTLGAEAQRVAQASTCGGCGAQGQFDVVAPASTPMSVRCRKCGHG